MASNYGMRFEDSDKIEVFLKDIIGDSQKAQETFLKASGQVAQKAVESNIHRSNYEYKFRSGVKKPHTHIKDDVQLSFATDKETGNKAAKIRGSKKTGTLWHLVNDGTYRTQGNHFMDKAMSEVDSKIDSILDATLAFLGE